MVQRKKVLDDPQADEQPGPAWHKAPSGKNAKEHAKGSILDHRKDIHEQPHNPPVRMHYVLGKIDIACKAQVMECGHITRREDSR